MESVYKYEILFAILQLLLLSMAFLLQRRPSSVSAFVQSYFFLSLHPLKHSETSNEKIFPQKEKSKEKTKRQFPSCYFCNHQLRKKNFGTLTKLEITKFDVTTFEFNGKKQLQFLVLLRCSPILALSFQTLSPKMISNLVISNCVSHPEKLLRKSQFLMPVRRCTTKLGDLLDIN